MAKVLIATGGTGGHIYPAIVIGKYLKNNGIDVVFTGRQKGMEKDLLQKEGFGIIDIKGKRFKGMKFISKIKSLLYIFPLIFSCFKILKKESPDFVIGTGGYVAAPVVLTAYLMRIKCAICEQNAYMGFGNRCLSFFVNHIFLSFKNTLKVPLRYKSKITGNFIREGFIDNRNKNKAGILVFGGSQGARSINNIFCSVIDEISLIKDIKIFHITGESDYEKVKKEYETRKGKLTYEIYPYYEDLNEIFENVTLTVCRAGATSVAEIYYSGKNAVLIPYPYAADNHQWFNAVEFCKSGKGVVLKENYLTKENLLKWIKFFLKRGSRFQSNVNVLGDYEKGLETILKIVRYSNI